MRVSEWKVGWISVEGGVKDGLEGTKEASEPRCGVAEEGGSAGWL